MRPISLRSKCDPMAAIIQVPLGGIWRAEIPPSEGHSLTMVGASEVEGYGGSGKCGEKAGIASNYCCNQSLLSLVTIDDKH